MSVFERVVLYASLIALGWFGFSLRAEFRRVHGVASAPVPAVSTNEIKQLFPSVLPASVPARPAAPKGRAVSFGTGEFKYAEFQGEPYLFIDGVRIIKGRLYKEGVCINLGSDFAMFSGAGGDTWIYKQEYESPRDVEAVALKDPPHVAHD